jgi:hypothetical protein
MASKELIKIYQEKVTAPICLLLGEQHKKVETRICSPLDNKDDKHNTAKQGNGNVKLKRRHG